MKAKRDYEPEVLLDLDAFDFARNYIVKYAVRRGYEKAVHRASNTASRYTTRRVREFMEWTTLTRRQGEASLTTGIHIGRPGSSLTNITAR